MAAWSGGNVLALELTTRVQIPAKDKFPFTAIQLQLRVSVDRYSLTEHTILTLHQKGIPFEIE